MLFNLPDGDTLYTALLNRDPTFDGHAFVQLAFSAGSRALLENQNAKTAPFTPNQQPALMQGFAPANDAIRCIP